MSGQERGIPEGETMPEPSLSELHGRLVERGDCPARMSLCSAQSITTCKRAGPRSSKRTYNIDLLDEAKQLAARFVEMNG